jgi:ribosome-binding protein aMBF1 (putative translation factor)
MAAKRKPARDVLQIIHRLFYEGKPWRMVELEETRASAAIARQIYDLREASGFSSRGLARLAGIPETAVRRFEEDDFDGESLESLKKIAHALGQRVDSRIVPDRRMRRPA